MKKTLHILSCAAVAIVALASCAKEQFKENTIPTGEKIQVSVNGQIGDFIPADATKADAASVVRVSWAEDDNVYVYDGTDASIGTLTVTPDPKNASQALLSGKITSIAPPAPTKLTLVYVKGATEAPAITGGKISIDLSKQDGKDVPFVLYATIDYNAQKLEKANEYVPFKFATSVMTVNCTGLQTGSENAVIGISKAEIEGVSTVCELAVTGSGVTVAGAKTGKITRTGTAEPSVFTQSDSRGSFKLALAADPAAPAARNILVHQGSKVSGAPFTTATLAGGKSYNTVYQLSEYISNTPDGMLSGEFTLPDGKKVRFSKGNLYAKKDNGTWTWHFYDNQYGYNSLNSQCEDGSRAATEGDTEIDLFTWGYDATNSVNPKGKKNISGHNTEGDLQLVSTQDGDDWGVAYCNSNEITAGTWRTLTTAEWQYLFNDSRMVVNGKPCYSNAMDGVNIGGGTTTYKGVFLYPDNYNGTVVSSSMTWDQINAAGIVFLPAAGVRTQGDVEYVGSYGLYFSSSANGSDKAYGVRFDSETVKSNEDDLRRGNGCSVRLVTESAGGYAPAVKVTGVTMGKEETSITVGKKETLVATIAPANAANKQITWSSSKPSVATVDENGVVTGVAAGSAVITATTSDGNFTAVCLVTVKTLPDVALKGEFSISDTTKVRFSKGNLYAKNEGSTESPDWKWHFYDEQYKYNYLSTSSSRTANANDTEIDLFTWGYDNTSTNTSYSLNPENTTGITGHDTEGNKQLNPSTGGDDWGVAYCESNSIDVGTWRTLSTAEWQYLFNKNDQYGKTCRSDKYKWATVNGVGGYVIAPDDFTGTLQESYADDAALAAAGDLVFLPAAGYRSGSIVDYDDGIDSYWSSTAYESGYAYYVCISSSNFSLGYSAPRSYGFSVRLITDVK